jgi:hypothetical protein
MTTFEVRGYDADNQPGPVSSTFTYEPGTGFVYPTNDDGDMVRIEVDKWRRTTGWSDQQIADAYADGGYSNGYMTIQAVKPAYRPVRAPR